MRLGCTSYTYPADILTNVRRLAGRVMDVELVIFEVRDPTRDLPDRSCIAELVRIASDHDMSFTVHLPLDLRLSHGTREASCERARQVIDCTMELGPYGYIVHLDDGRRDKIHVPWQSGGTAGPSGSEGHTVRSGPGSGEWLENSLASLEALAPSAGGAARLCVENLEIHAPEMIDAVLEAIPVSCCIDVGHLWVTGQAVVPLLERWLPRARVIHMHGVDGTDHLSLDRSPPEKIDRVTPLLADFQGVVTLEVFNERDLETSLAAFQDSLERVQA